MKSCQDGLKICQKPFMPPSGVSNSDVSFQICWNPLFCSDPGVEAKTSTHSIAKVCSDVLSNWHN